MEQHCLLFRCSVFDRIGPYDEELNTRDEIDLSLALYKAGIGVVFEPKCEVHYIPPYPPRPDETDYFFMKWDIERTVKSRDQNHERTYPLISVPHYSTITSTSLNSYIAGSGAIYTKVSPAGKMSEFRNDFSRFTTKQQPFIAKRDDTAHHYALVTIRATAELTVNVYSLVGDGSPKTLIDSFRISHL
jgi:hypothetical protein